MKAIRFGPVVIFTLCVVLFTTMAFAEAPAPFWAAKMHAMSRPADGDGNYVWELEKTTDGEQVYYALVYLTKLKGIMIIRTPFICSYDETTGEIRAGVFMGMGIMPIDKPPEEIIDFAFKIFRELVEANALMTII